MRNGQRFGSRASVAVLGVVLSTACTAPDSRSEPEAVTPTSVGEITLEIGALEGEDPYLFGSITGLAQDTLGRVYVADGQASEIRVFDGEGEFLWSFGRGGEGPGEFGGICCLGIGPNHQLWVRDNGNARYSAFELYGSRPEFRMSVRMGHSAANLHAPVFFDSQGRLVDVGARPDETGLVFVRLHTVLDGTVDSTVTIRGPRQSDLGVHEVAVESQGRRAIVYLSQPFGPVHLIAHGPIGRWAEAVSSVYSVEVHGSGGTVNSILGPAIQGPVLSQGEREDAEEAIERERRRAGLSVGDMPFGVPDRKPPLQELYFDQDGRLWVEINSSGDYRAADIYSVSGDLLEHRQWPGSVRAGTIAWIGTSELLGVRRDSLGVSYVVRVQFGR